MRYHTPPFLLLAAALIGSACHSSASSRRESATLSAGAQVDATTARSTALAKVPGGQVIKEELEEENGRLVYSYDIKKGSEPGVEEVQVDAHDGTVVSVKHEDAATEAKEMQADSAKH
jgi:hypothetical protein